MGSVCSFDEQHPLSTYYVPGAVGVLARSLPSRSSFVHLLIHSFIHLLILAQECIHCMSLLCQAPCWAGAAVMKGMPHTHLEASSLPALLLDASQAPVQHTHPRPPANRHRREVPAPCKGSHPVVWQLLPLPRTPSSAQPPEPGPSGTLLSQT